MIHTVNVQDLDSFEPIRVSDEDACKIPLFHGTRRYTLESPVEDRERFYSACDIVMHFAKELANSNYIDETQLTEYKRNHNRNFLNTLVYAYGDNKFTYGDFYVTSSYTTAISFSHNIGGELGNTAYAQCLGFQYFGIAVDETVANAINIVTEEYHKYLNSEKIIIAFYGIKFSDLTRENGTPFLINAINPQQEAYNLSIIRRLNKSIETDISKSNANFSISNLDTYTGLVIGEQLFRTGFSTFTQIKNVEKKINDHNFDSPDKWDF